MLIVLGLVLIASGLTGLLGLCIFPSQKLLTGMTERIAAQDELIASLNRHVTALQNALAAERARPSQN